jgi:hypothetical protein
MGRGSREPPRNGLSATDTLKQVIHLEVRGNNRGDYAATELVKNTEQGLVMGLRIENAA